MSIRGYRLKILKMMICILGFGVGYLANLSEIQIVGVVLGLMLIVNFLSE